MSDEGESAEMAYCDAKSLQLQTLRMTSEAKVCALPTFNCSSIRLPLGRIVL